MPSARAGPLSGAMPVPLPVMYSHWSDSSATFDRLRVCSKGLNRLWRALKPYCGQRGSAFVRPDTRIARPARPKTPAQNLLAPRCMDEGRVARFLCQTKDERELTWETNWKEDRKSQ